MPATAIEFDFATKVERSVDLDTAYKGVADGRFVWFDLDLELEDTPTREILCKLNVDADVIEDVMGYEVDTRYDLHEHCLHLVLTSCKVGATGGLELLPVEVVIGERFLVTLRRGKVGFIDMVRKHYRADFVRFAKSPSFLIYELWDHLVDAYQAVAHTFEDRVEQMQALLMGKVDDTIFAKVSELQADLLHFRKVLLPARSVLTELSTRKTLFVSEATQPFLSNFVGTIERVLADVMVDREILSESLNLYMSIVGHRTNRVMNKLTVVSVIFLPLTFLCGVYGMNFEFLPEFGWKYGYVYFWTIAAIIVTTVLIAMRRIGLL